MENLKDNPKYEFIISLARSSFTPDEVTELTLESILSNGEIRQGKKVHKLSKEDIENIGIYLKRNKRKFEETKYLFPAKDLGKSDTDKLVMWTYRYLRTKGQSLDSIGWEKVAKVKQKAPPRTLEEIMAFVARYK
ncbi:hypothetical protein [Anaerospora hongkongensis]|uniref:hypothetical protein n=1 Tax=Anaerospora hongkongensis TaxID=244830 RepID=UPI002FDAFD10